jgi:hypothetical protein
VVQALAEPLIDRHPGRELGREAVDVGGERDRVDLGPQRGELWIRRGLQGRGDRLACEASPFQATLSWTEPLAASGATSGTASDQEV